jgi:hypothetical protein
VQRRSRTSPMVGTKVGGPVDQGADLIAERNGVVAAV